MFQISKRKVCQVASVWKPVIFLVKNNKREDHKSCVSYKYWKTRPCCPKRYNKKGTGSEVINRTVPWRRMFPRLGPLGPEIQQVSDQCHTSNLHDPPQSTRQGLGKTEGEKKVLVISLWKNLGKDFFQSN